MENFLFVGRCWFWRTSLQDNSAGPFCWRTPGVSIFRYFLLAYSDFPETNLPVSCLGSEGMVARFLGAQREKEASDPLLSVYRLPLNLLSLLRSLCFWCPPMSCFTLFRDSPLIVCWGWEGISECLTYQNRGWYLENSIFLVYIKKIKYNKMFIS